MSFFAFAADTTAPTDASAPAASAPPAAPIDAQNQQKSSAPPKVGTPKATHTPRTPAEAKKTAKGPDAAATGKKKDAKSDTPATPDPQKKEMSPEDLEILNALMNSEGPDPTEKQEMARLAQLTLEKSPTLKAALNDWQVARFTTQNTRAALLPTVFASTTVGQRGFDPNIRVGETNNYGNVTLTMSEVLYDNGVTLNTLDQNEKDEERLHLSYEYARDTQLLSVMQNYLNWSQAIQTKKLDDLKRKILQRQYAFKNAQFHQGIGSKLDVLRLESQLRGLQLDTLTDESSVVISKQQLLDVLGVTKDEFDQLKFHGEETGAVDDPGSGTDKPLVLEQHRELKIFRLQEKEADVNIRLAERDYYPHLDVHMDGGYINDDYMMPHVSFDNNYAASWDALLILSWTMMDWGVRSRNIQIAKVKSESVRDRDRQTELDLEVQLQQVMQKLAETKLSLSLAHELMTLEQQNFNTLENDYRDGRAGYLDLIDEINNYIGAKSRFMTAYFALRTQKLNYLFHRGDLFSNLTAP